MKKRFLALLLVAAAGMGLSGCASGNAMSSTPSPSPAASPSPRPTAVLTTSPVPAATVQPAPEMTPEEAGRMAGKIAEAVERISEVKEAEVVLSGERALVAVEFDDQYSAGLDLRMKDTIVKTAQKVAPDLKDVQVTDDGTLYGQIKKMAEGLANAVGLDEMADDFASLWDRVTGK